MEMIFRNDHTTNHAETVIRVLKEMIFGHMKAYIQLDTNVQFYHRHHGELLQKQIVGYGTEPLSTRNKVTFEGCLQTYKHLNIFLKP